MQTITAFEVAIDTAIDEMQVELVENQSLPAVVNERNPFRFTVEYSDGRWVCEGVYQCRENPDECVTIHREYTAETIALLSRFYVFDED